MAAISKAPLYPCLRIASIQRGLTTRARNTRVVSSDSVRVRTASGPGVVADVGGRVLAGQRAHGGDHAAVVLEVVVGVGDVVLAGVECSSPPPRSGGTAGSCRRWRPHRRGRGRRRTRPTPCRPRPGRRRRASSCCRSAAADRRRRFPASSRRSGSWSDVGRRVRRGRPARGRGRSCARRARRVRRPVPRRRRAWSRRAGRRRGRTPRCGR